MDEQDRIISDFFKKLADSQESITAGMTDDQIKKFNQALNEGLWGLYES